MLSFSRRFTENHVLKSLRIFSVIVQEPGTIGFVRELFIPWISLLCEPPGNGGDGLEMGAQRLPSCAFDTWREVVWIRVSPISRVLSITSLRGHLSLTRVRVSKMAFGSIPFFVASIRAYVIR